MLSAGGTAADAAVALGFALAVTLPSRAGLGGGGACLVLASGQPVEAVSFLPRAPAHPGTAERPAAVPMLARGLYALHSKYGNRTFDSLLGPAETMARDGVTAPRAFVRDLAIVAGPLAADPAARSTFFPNGRPVQEGALLLQPGLASTIAELRQSGVGDLYQGVLAHLFVDATRDAGGGLTIADLRGALPDFPTPLVLPAGDEQVAFLPPPADGGLAAAAAWQTLQAIRPHWRRPAAVRSRSRRSSARAAATRRRCSRPPTCRRRRCRRSPPRPRSSRWIATATRSPAR